MNESSIITLILMAVFFAAMILVGIRSRKHASDINGFVLGSRQVGPWLSAFAYGTSYFSAVIFVGYAGQFGWNFGLASTWIGLGNAFIGSLLAWVILGRRTRIMTQHLSSKTMPDFFGTRYESKGLKTAAALITFVFLIPYTASLYNGLSRLFSMAFPGVDYTVCVIIMAVLTGVYVIVGGYMATAWNDFIQGIIMLFGIVAVIGAVLHDNGGLMEAMKGLATGSEGGWEFASFLGPNPLFLLFVVILTSLGTWGLPQMVGKFYAIRSEGAIHKGT
ncbi:MAG: sodium:solute symporter, partial [Lachnospiraceae bacterium]|nr:sodium:solute symporter [Lachnospiraceae bacterium]